MSSLGKKHSHLITHHTKKQIVEIVIASLATNIVPRANYKSIRPQNDPTPYEHAK
jgi:hypothetical protein